MNKKYLELTKLIRSKQNDHEIYKFLLILFHFILKPPVYKAFTPLLLSQIALLHTFYTLYTASIFLISSNKVSSVT